MTFRTFFKVALSPIGAIPILLILLLIALVLGWFNNTASAAPRPSTDIVITSKTTKARSAQDAGQPQDNRAALLSFLERINKQFKEATGSKRDILFTVYWSVDQPNAGAIVLNEVPNPDGGQGVVFGKFFYQTAEGWTMLPDTFER